ncbi:Hypothetical predicted protein [Paramuricea clavata]|uniref:Uncharacterized protein n=1 Tax=Paramuricea clavata TaxID=317549 RepID=A0A6S7GRW8_PARCT|nr:Hypothetical predicted protein [Paramuricea clavata]
MIHQENESSTSSETDSDGGGDDSDQTGDENHPQAIVQIQSPKTPEAISQPTTAPVSNVNGGQFQEDAQIVNQQSEQGDTNQLPLQESEAQPQVVGVNPVLGMELGAVIVLDDENVQDMVLVTTVQTTPAIMEEV